MVHGYTAIEVTVFELMTVVGGLALFLYGVRMLSQGMEQLAGGKVQQWLDRATSHPLKGATFGAMATAVIQSSGLLMVTMIGLINARLLTLEQAIGVMLGQEIGTTITGQLVAFSIGSIRFVAVALGFLMLEFGRERRLQRYRQILMGFGLMFMGREFMADTVRPLAAHPLVAQWLAQMAENPLLAVLAGIILTGIIQSSTATTGLVITMGAGGVITAGGDRLHLRCQHRLLHHRPHGGAGQLARRPPRILRSDHDQCCMLLQRAPTCCPARG